MNQNVRVKGVADMVFLIDATGSMASCINALKDHIGSFIASLTNEDPERPSVIKDWRIKIVGYRDFDYSDAEPIVDNPFTSSVEEAREHLAGLEAKGGGDEAESLLEGLYRVATMPATEHGEMPRGDAWRFRREAHRFVIAFTDAPYKAKMSEPKGGTVDDVIHAMMTSRIVLYVYAPEIFKCYETLQEMDKSEWHPVPVAVGETAIEALARYTSNRDNFQKILDTLAKTMTATGGGPPPL